MKGEAIILIGMVVGAYIAALILLTKKTEKLVEPSMEKAKEFLKGSVQYLIFIKDLRFPDEETVLSERMLEYMNSDDFYKDLLFSHNIFISDKIVQKRAKNALMRMEVVYKELKNTHSEKGFDETFGEWSKDITIDMIDPFDNKDKKEIDKIIGSEYENKLLTYYKARYKI